MACLFVEQLCVIDCASLHPKSGLRGESWIVDLQLEGGLDEQGMVFDFGLVKPRVKAIIDERIDHRLLVPSRSDALSLEHHDGHATLEFSYGDARLYHRSPVDALCLLDTHEVSLRMVEECVAKEIESVMPGNVTGVRISLREEDIAGAWYRYSHGLRQHDGNCQRIAHGHRSRIEIFRDGQRSEASERWLAERWRDAYIASRADIKTETTLSKKPCYHFAYSAPQGEFELILEQSHCELLHTESTVECIAEHIGSLLKERDPEACYLVRAYEGVRKGAIATS
ncbi:MAG: 6-pyruvoyl trahydropterin synthase family protein [Gammaproteobacteria bacterium]